MEEKAANIQLRALNVIQKAWRTIPEDCLAKLKESLAKQIQVVLKKGHTKC